MTYNYIVNKILLATNNQHKISEIKAILADLPVELVTPAEIGLADFVPAENGATYAENAARKARAFAQRSNLPVLADDSGVEVAALQNFPGVQSARWLPGSDEDRMLALWRKMKNISQRDFTYQAVICYVDRARQIEEFFTGTLSGSMALEPRGHNNFGYDPIMIPAGQTQTQAEMTPAQKNEFSHRGQALRKFATWYLGQTPK